MQIKPTGSCLGADILDIDLSQELSDQQFSDIVEAWYSFSILRFRKQELSDDEFVNFSRRFGSLDLAPTGRGGKPFNASRPEIAIISNIIVNGEKAGSLGNSELVWHQDMSYVNLPPKASVLYGIEIPKSSGDTSFYSAYEAYSALPPKLRTKINGLTCKHDATRNSAGELRVGYAETYHNKERPGAIHPLVILHPNTKRKALYLGRRPNAWIYGFSSEASDALLDELWDHINSHNFTWTQNWEKGDLVIWDNRCTFHRREKLDPIQNRLMHRLQIADDYPPTAPS